MSMIGVVIEMRASLWFFGCVLFLAGNSCSDGGSKPNSDVSGSGGSSTSSDPCGVVSISEIESTVGVSGLGAPRLTESTSLVQCLYGQGTIPGVVQIRYELGVKLSDYEELRASFDTAGQPTTDLPNLGEAAFTVTTANVVLVGSYSTGKSLIVHAPATLDKVQALSSLVLGRL